MKTNEKAVKETYRLAIKAYETWDIDTETVMSTLDGLPISLHCWQGDDVGGFETPDGLLTGGIMATCAYPGKARSGDELRSDIDQALALIPGSHRLNLHAIYAETGDKVVDRTESCVIGSHEFYMGYAATRNTLLCLDAGHFHPTEVISNKISSSLLFLEGLLLHVSRPVRWDSDHLVILNDELMAIAQEIIRSGQTERIHIGLDFFDASINRIAAWVIGTRNTQKALLFALLENHRELSLAEHNFNYADSPGNP